MVVLHYDLDAEYYDDENPRFVPHGPVEYECEPTVEDIVDFVFDAKTQRRLSEAWGGIEGIAFRQGMADGLKDMIARFDGMKDLLEEYLSEDEDFIEYLKDEYREEALGGY